MCIFHEKIITFLFVTLSRMIRYSSNLYRRREIQLSYWICTLKCPMTPFPRIFLLKTWNFHCTRTSKNWKINDFFVFLVLSSYCFLRVKSCVEHVFAGFRAIRCRKRIFLEDLEKKKQLFYGKICTLLFVTLSHMIGLSSIFLQKTYNTFTLPNIYILMHNNTFAADFFLKTCNFHCTRRSKIENFKYCKSSISWKLQKWSQRARTCSDCSYVLPDHASVRHHAHAETSQSLLSEFTPPLPRP